MSTNDFEQLYKLALALRSQNSELVHAIVRAKVKSEKLQPASLGVLAPLAKVAQDEVARITSNIKFLEERDWTYVEIRGNAQAQAKVMAERVVQCMAEMYPEPTAEQIEAHRRSWISPCYTCGGSKLNCTRCWSMEAGPWTPVLVLLDSGFYTTGSHWVAGKKVGLNSSGVLVDIDRAALEANPHFREDAPSQITVGNSKAIKPVQSL
jgi:hypothetical protein